MVPNRGMFLPPSCIQNAPINVHHEHPGLWRTSKEHVLKIVEVTCMTKEGHKHVHTISEVFVTDK